MAKGAPVSCKALVGDGTCAAHSQKRPEVIGICRKTLFKGSSTNKILLPNILDRCGVWYSSLWLEGPKSYLNVKMLVSKYVSKDLKRRHTLDLEGRTADLKGWHRGSDMQNLFIVFSIYRSPPYINYLDNSRLKNQSYPVC